MCLFLILVDSLLLFPDLVDSHFPELVDNLLETLTPLLKRLSLNSRISAKAMSEKMSEKNLNVERTIERDVAKLKKLGILTRKGGRKDGEWLLTELGQRVLEERSATKLFEFNH